MVMLDFGMRKLSIKENLISILTSISNLKKKYTLRRRIKSLLISIGLKLRRTIGLFRMLLGVCGSIIYRVIRDSLFIRLTLEKSMIFRSRLSIIAWSLLETMDLLDCGTTEIEDSFITEGSLLTDKLLVSNGCHFLKGIMEEY